MTPAAARRLFDWLDELGLVEHFYLFQSANVTLERLPGLDDKALEALGMTDPRARASLRAGLQGEIGAEALGYRVVTIVMIDMVASTETARREGPEAMRRRLSRLRTVVEEEARRFDGRIVQHVGDGSVLHFGWPLSREGDAERAAMAALRIRDRLLADAEGAADPTRVRVGLATGTVLSHDEVDAGHAPAGADVVGLTAHLAARLQASAAENQIMVCARTADLVRSEIRLGVARRLGLKGFETPVEAYPLLGHARAATRYDARSGNVRRVLFGREAERARLQAAFEAALSGNGSAVAITGSAGIGKSRLARTLEEIARGGGAKLRKLQCSALFSNTAFHPFARLAEQDVGISAGGDPAARASRLLSELAPDSAQPLRVATIGRFFEAGSIDQSALRGVAAEVYVAELEAMFSELVLGGVETCPVLILVEDLHWIDDRSLRLIGALADRLRDQRALLLLTARALPSELEQRGDLLRLPLEPLAAEAAEMMVRDALAEHRLETALATQVTEIAAGVPLFIEELAKSLAAREGTEDGELNLAVPISLKTGFMERLDRLGSAKVVAQQASCFGDVFAPKALSQLLGVSEEDLRPRLDLLCAREIMRPAAEDAGLIEFSHALLREEAYESLTDARKIEIHGKLADVLANAWEAPEVVAHHATLAGRHALAASRWVQAGEAAMERLSYTGALQHYNRALIAHGAAAAEGAGDAVAELAVMLRASDCLAFLKGWSDPLFHAAAQRAAEAAERVGDSDALIAARAALSLSCFDQGRLDEARLHAAAIGAIGNGGALGAFLQDAASVHPCFFSADFAGALHHARAAIASFDDVSAPTGVAAYFYALCRLSEGWSLWALGQEAESVAAIDATVARYPADQAPFLRTYALVFKAILGFFRCDRARQRAAAEEGVALAEAYGFTWFHGILLIFRAEALLHEGTTEAAKVELERGMGLAYTPNSRSGLPTILDIVSRFHLAIGDREDALNVIAQARAIAAETGQSYWNAELLRREGAIRAAGGEVERGMKLVTAAAVAAAVVGAVPLEVRARRTLRAFAAKSGSSIIVAGDKGGQEP